ncbi:MAG: cupredoxin domain-containing protein [Patescibacteria group bacterium]
MGAIVSKPVAMKQFLIFSLILIGLTAQSCGKVAVETDDNQPADNSSEAVEMDQKVLGSTADDMEVVLNKTVVVSYDGSGFSPVDVTLKVGDKIRFVNESDKSVWPAANPHPIHTSVPGLDSGRALAKGESFEFEFKSAGSFGFHNHLNPSQGGSILVQ